MHEIRQGRSHLKGQALISSVLTGISGDLLSTPSDPVGSIGTILSLGGSNSSTTLSTTSFSTPFTSGGPSTSSSSTVSQSTTSSTSSTSTASPSIYRTTSWGSVHTAVTFVDPSPSPTQTVVPIHKTFLQNKALSGVVFALGGLAGLLMILTVASCALRRRRNKRLMQEAISFDPVSINDSYYHNAGMGRSSVEKRNTRTMNS